MGYLAGGMYWQVYLEDNDDRESLIYMGTTGSNYGIQIFSDTTIVISSPDGLYLFPSSAAPPNPLEGTIYYDNDDHMMYFWNGSAWKAMNYTP
jgi:hypothetical protein